MAINNILKEITPPLNALFLLMTLQCIVQVMMLLLPVSICKDLSIQLQNGLKFSSVKSVAMRFSRSRHVEEIPTLTLKGGYFAI